jgi:hypothetical protein
MSCLRNSRLYPGFLIALATVPLSVTLAGQSVARADSDKHNAKDSQDTSVDKKSSHSTAAPSSSLDQQYAYIKAVGDAEAVLDTAGKLQKQIGDQVTALKIGTEGLDASEDGLKKLSALVDLVPKLDPAVVNNKLTKQIKSIQDAQADLNKKHDLLLKLTSAEIKRSFADLKVALGKFSGLIKDLIEMQSDLKDLQGELGTAPPPPGVLTKALSSVSAQEAKMLDKIRGKLLTLQNLPQQAKTDQLRHTLHDEIGNLKTSLLLRYKADSDLTKLHKALLKLAVPDQDAAAALAACDKTLLGVLTKSQTWLTTLAQDTLDESKEGDLSFERVLLDPRKYSTEAQTNAAYLKGVAQDLDTIDSGLKASLTPLGQGDFPAEARPAGYDAQPFGDRLPFLEQAIQRLNIVALKLAQPYPLDITHWDADQINLYYFDDVTRLIQVLNDKAEIRRNDTDASTAADKARTALNTASQDVLVKRQTVNDLRRQIADNGDALRVGKNDILGKQNQADNALRASKARSLRSAAAERQAKLRLDEAQAEADRAKAEQDLADKRLTEASADKTTETLTLTRLKARRDAADQNAIRANDRADIAQAALTKATSENTSAGDDLKSVSTDNTSLTGILNGEVTDLKAKLASAVSDESKAEDSLRSATTTAFLTAQADNLSFARARDNAPFLVSLPTTDQLSTNSDPLKRVMLFGFPDSRTLFIRGSEADVALVKEMVAKFDQPQAQAEMSVYTLEISSDTTSAGIRRFQEALKAVQEELAIHRVQSDVALTLLRECINDEVMGVKPGMPVVPMTTELKAANYFDFYDPKVVDALGLTAFKTHEGKFASGTADKLVPLFLPNPSCTATLAEALVVLALAKEEARGKIVAAFTTKLQGRLSGELKQLPTVSGETLNNLKRTADKEKRARTEFGLRNVLPFSNFRRLFVSVNKRDAPDVCAFQKELVTELRNNALTSLLVLLRGLKSQDEFLENKMTDVDRQLQYVFQDVKKKLLEVQDLQAKTKEAANEKKIVQDQVEAAKKSAMQAKQEMNQLQPHFIIPGLSRKPLSLAEQRQFAVRQAAQQKTHDADALYARAEQENMQADKQVSNSEHRFYEALIELPLVNPSIKSTLLKMITGTNAPVASPYSEETVAKLVAVRTEMLTERKGIIDKISVPAKYVFLSRNIESSTVKGFLEQYVTALTDQDAQWQSSIKTFSDSVRAFNASVPASEGLSEQDFKHRLDNLVLPDPNLVTPIDNPLKQLDKQSLSSLIATIEGLRDFDFYERHHAQVAKLNETLKRFIHAVDEDMKGQYLNPMLNRLQDRLMAKHLGVGIFQHTTILASNRLVARVDPQATAQVALGEEQNVLQEALQLAQLVATAQTGGALGAINGLKGLSAQPKQPAPGIYGISTGNMFQVTPIFDPTGQAMRFRFDYVAANQIQEPNGTIDPQLPRIERHSINTEVQLSNYDVRLVSSFNANAKLGLPTRTWGGIPVLKDIPILKEIPIIGWFTKRGGQAAVAQQSLILTQASMYPTVQDVIHLLTQSQTSSALKIEDLISPLAGNSAGKAQKAAGDKNP